MKTVKMNIIVDVPENWEERLDMQPLLEAEITADRWRWEFRPKMNFSAALHAIKRNEKVARVGWNGKGMYVHLAKLSSVPGTTEFELDSFMVLKGANDRFNAWVPSVADCLAEDWEIV
jgi:hypothetical protein